MVSSMVGFHGTGLRDTQFFKDFAVSVLGVILVSLFILTNLNIDTWHINPQRSWTYAVSVAFLLILCLMLLNQSSPFLYFQF